MSTPPSGEPPYPGSQPNQPEQPANQGYPNQGYPNQGYPPGGYQGYPQGGYGGPPVPRNGLGVTALVLGILAVLTFFTIVGGIVLGLLALIFGIIGLRRVGKRLATNKGVAVSGIVLGVLGVIASAVFVAVGTTFFFNSGGGDLVQCLRQAGSDQAKVLQCQQQYQQQVQNQYGGGGR